MNSTRLNEHHSDLGAQSKGEFLGMTGNSAWYLLAAAGLTILLVILLWGIFGMSLLVCLTMGAGLCALSVAYVFGLKNNRPEHYDTDFFEAALVEAGVLPMAFGPRTRRLPNPFRDGSCLEITSSATPQRRPTARVPFALRTQRSPATPSGAKQPVVTRSSTVAPKHKALAPEPVIALTAYEALRDELDHAEEMLEDALVERGEN